MRTELESDLQNMFIHNLLHKNVSTVGFDFINTILQLMYILYWMIFLWLEKTKSFIKNFLFMWEVFHFPLLSFPSILPFFSTNVLAPVCQALYKMLGNSGQCLTLLDFKVYVFSHLQVHCTSSISHSNVWWFLVIWLFLRETEPQNSTC